MLGSGVFITSWINEWIREGKKEKRKQKGSEEKREGSEEEKRQEKENEDYTRSKDGCVLKTMDYVSTNSVLLRLICLHECVCVSVCIGYTHIFFR